MTVLTRKPRIIWAVALFIVLIAFVLRLHKVNLITLWIDELYMWYYANGWPNPAAVGARYYVYSSILFPSMKLLPGELGLRWPSIVAGVLSVATIFQIGRLLSRWQAGLIAAALLAVSPVAIHYSREATSYSLLTLGALTSILLAVLLDRQHLRWPRLAYPLCLVIVSTLHLLSAPWLMVQLGILILRKWLTGKGASYWYLAGCVACVIGGVGIVQLIGRFGSYAGAQGLGWIPRPELLPEVVNFIGLALGINGASETTNPLPIALAIVGVICGIAGAVPLAKAARRNQEWGGIWTLLLLSGLATAVPAALLAVSYGYRPLWGLRFVISSVVSLVLLLSIGLANIRPRFVGLLVAGVLIGYGAFVSINTFSEKLSTPEGWRDALNYIAENSVQDKTLIVYCQDWYKPAVDFYGTALTQDTIYLNDSQASREQTVDVLATYDQVFVVAASGCLRTADDFPDTRLPKGNFYQMIKFESIELYIYRQ